ncbi:DNA-directed RNA polymerase subunit RPC12/RpoP [Nocardia transvalensis]|uniref:DNA-directed RNA polymerase subunit RPC12/RpoP n=1 Tax=Nocardia transvalensis TaxID=37333 RepID=A0A7W9PNE2_9NOCA|nr:DNA-directed RNA polymerase subunit RPC12/RpoP [Nocardia transvalensis]
MTLRVGDGVAFRAVDGKVVQLGRDEALWPEDGKNGRDSVEVDRVARRLIGIALWWLPKGSQGRFRAEWLAELEEMAREGISSLLPAFRILRGAPAQGQALRAALRRRARATAALPPAFGPRTWLITIESDNREPHVLDEEPWRRIPSPPKARDGDVVAYRNAAGLLGTAVVEVSSDQGLFPACPHCRSRRFYTLPHRLMRYRCSDCYDAFDRPKGIMVRYGDDRSIDWFRWVELAGLLSFNDLEALRIGRRSRGGVVELHSTAFRKALTAARKAQAMRYGRSASVTGSYPLPETSS